MVLNRAFQTVRGNGFSFSSVVLTWVIGLCLMTPSASGAGRHFPLVLKPDDVVPTGNEWISLPDIRAVDGALNSFNVISMEHRGLLEVTGEGAGPVMQPYFAVGGKQLPFLNPTWDLMEYWIPTARLTVDGMEATLTWCAPPGSRAAFLRLTVTNRRKEPTFVTLGLRASFGKLSRVTYVPVELRGERTVGPAPWVDPGEAFSYITNDTQFAWAVIHPGSTAQVTAPPTTAAPAIDASRSATLAPGETAESLFILGAGIEEFSAAHNARALRELLERDGSDAILERAAAWCRERTKTTGQADLDLLMNRNYLFTELYAWGKTIDTEQTCGHHLTQPSVLRFGGLLGSRCNVVEFSRAARHRSQDGRRCVGVCADHSASKRRHA